MKREEMKREMKEYAKNRIKNHMKDHVSAKFMRRIKHLYGKIEKYLMLDEYDHVDDVVLFTLHMIQKEIRNAYCRSVLTFRILEAGKYWHGLFSFDKIVNQFEKEFEEIVREDDLILTQSWIDKHCKIVAEKERTDKTFLAEVILAEKEIDGGSA